MFGVTSLILAYSNAIWHNIPNNGTKWYQKIFNIFGMKCVCFVRVPRWGRANCMDKHSYLCRMHMHMHQTHLSENALLYVHFVHNYSIKNFKVKKKSFFALSKKNWNFKFFYLLSVNLSPKLFSPILF